MRNILIIFILGAILSCQTKEKPKLVLTQAQLSSLLVDIYFAEARTESIPKGRDSTIRYFLPFKRSLLKGPGISAPILQLTNTNYLSNPKELEQVFDSAVEALMLLEHRTSILP